MCHSRRHFLNISKAVLFLFFLLSTPSFLLRAGVVSTMAGGPEVEGKLTLMGASLHVEGSSAHDIDLSDVLAADFSDVPFHLQYFQSEGDNANQLPPDWKTKAIGPPSATGSASYAAGTLTMTAEGFSPIGIADEYFFAGMPWNGDGQWTAYLKDLAPPLSPTQPSVTEAVMILRSGLNAGDPMLGVGVTGDGSETMHYGASYKGFRGDFPTWVRLTRCGKSLETALSKDAKVWNVISQDATAIPSQAWVGLMVNGRVAKGKGSAVIDQISFIPGSAQPEMVPPGFLLTSGSFLAGNTFHVSSTDAGITHDDKDIPLKTEQLAAAVYHPITMTQLAALSAPQGVIMKNGDFLESSIENVGARDGGGMVQMISLSLGVVAYYTDLIRACVANPLHEMASDYEVRLHDGSIIRAKNFGLTNGQVVIQEINGISIPVDPSEIAQVRAGLTRVQPLISLPWKVPEISKAKTTAEPAAGVSNLDVQAWGGPNQEQILVVPAGASLEFPFKDKFSSLVMGLAVAPGSPANAEATLRIMVGGKVVSHSQSFKAGDAPRSIRVDVADPRSVVLAVDSVQPGARLLLIDPIAVRRQAMTSSQLASPASGH